MAIEFTPMTLPTSGGTGWAPALNANFDAIDQLSQFGLVKGVAAEAIDPYEVVVVDPSGTVSLAASNDYAGGVFSGAFGIAVSKAGTGDTIIVRTRGQVTNASWAWSGPRYPIYLGTTYGALTTTWAQDAVPMGVTLSATSILFKPYVFKTRTKTTRFENAQSGNNWYVFVEDLPTTIVSCAIIADAGTSGSNAGKYWEFTLYNLTQSQQLAQRNTNGNEITADTQWSLGTISNAGLASHDVLELRAVRVGGPSDWTGAEVMVMVEAVMRF